MKYENLQKAHTLVDGYSQAEQDVLKPFLPALPTQKPLSEIIEDVYEAYMCAEDEDNSDRLAEIHYQLENLTKTSLPRSTAFYCEDYVSLPDGSIVMGLGEPRMKICGQWRFGINDVRSDRDMAGSLSYIVRKGQGHVQ